MDSLRSLLVHVDGGRHSAQRLELARELAARHEATLRALCAISPVPQDLALLHQHTAKANFHRVESAGGWPMRWLQPTDDQPVPAFVQRAFHADLLVLGQQDLQDDEASTVPRDFVPEVTMASGTPALVVPCTGRLPSRFGVVLLAWQPSRESARALAASLPLLRQADEVHLLTWMDDHDTAREAQHAAEEHLAQHGIGLADRHRGRVPRDTGEALLAAAAGVGADLLVMGCYSHSPARELVLGGTTRSVLHGMHLPVLMAH